MYHSQFYKYKRRFLTRGLEGLKGPATGPQELSDDYAAGDDVNARDSGDQTGPHRPGDGRSLRSEAQAGDGADRGVDDLHREAESGLQGASRREFSSGRTPLSGHVLRGLVQRR